MSDDLMAAAQRVVQSMKAKIQAGEVRPNPIPPTAAARATMMAQASYLHGWMSAKVKLMTATKRVGPVTAASFRPGPCLDYKFRVQGVGPQADLAGIARLLTELLEQAQCDPEALKWTEPPPAVRVKPDEAAAVDEDDRGHFVCTMGW